MSKIPDQPNQSPAVSQSVYNDEINTGKLGGKQVSRTESKKVYLKKTSVGISGALLNRRQITKNSLHMMIALGTQQQWPALGSAILLHGNSLENLGFAMDTLQQHGIKLPAQIQNQAGLRFTELASASTAATLHSNLPEDALQALNMLNHIAVHHNNHESPIGTISCLAVNEFIDKYQLNDADRESMIKNMSATVYSLISEKMKHYENSVLSNTTDEEITTQIKYSQNERRIEESFWQEDINS